MLEEGAPRALWKEGWVDDRSGVDTMRSREMCTAMGNRTPGVRRVVVTTQLPQKNKKNENVSPCLSTAS